MPSSRAPYPCVVHCPAARRDRRSFLALLTAGLAWTVTSSAVVSCSPVRGEGRPAATGPAPTTPATTTAAPPSAPSTTTPGTTTTASANSLATLTHGPDGGKKIALTIDDGYCQDCVRGYVAFAQRTGVHLTFSPNGTYGHVWEPCAKQLAPLIERGQVQIMNHTFSHRDLRTMTEQQIGAELERNEEWVNRTFATTTRPYYRPPYGLRNAAVDRAAARLGYAKTVLWNGSYSDSEAITPQFLLSQARKYLKPGTIMLGHANHPTVLGLFDQIQDLIRQRELTPVTLDEMFGTTRPSPAHAVAP
ncbi:MAG: polysaccharide deacetylase family protein [Kutzneria sp.]|nr:polysaccharide deacetylase family protein [Kutzneria sp.]